MQLGSVLWTGGRGQGAGIYTEVLKRTERHFFDLI
jgi:hypothetical protein